MNRIASGLTVLTLFIAAGFSADSWVVRNDGIGPVKVGITPAQLRAVLHEPLIRGESGNDGCYYVHTRSRKHLQFMIEDGKLVRIDVNAPGIPTATGIQVGGSEAHVRQVYGDELKVTDHKYIDTGHYLTVRSKNYRYGTRFETDKGKVTTFYAGTYEAIQYVEGCE